MQLVYKIIFTCHICEADLGICGLLQGSVARVHGLLALLHLVEHGGHQSYTLVSQSIAVSHEREASSHGESCVRQKHFKLEYICLRAQRQLSHVSYRTVSIMQSHAMPCNALTIFFLNPPSYWKATRQRFQVPLEPLPMAKP
jgi:hypothetical protein